MATDDGSEIPSEQLDRLDCWHLTIHNIAVTGNCTNDIATVIKKRRISIPLTLRELASRSGVSSSHLGRVERGERFPSAHILRKIAEALGFDEGELFMLAGFLSGRSPAILEHYPARSSGQLDPYVARVLSQEPIDV